MADNDQSTESTDRKGGHWLVSTANLLETHQQRIASLVTLLDTLKLSYPVLEKLLDLDADILNASHLSASLQAHVTLLHNLYTGGRETG